MTEELGEKFVLHTIQGRTADEVIISAHGRFSFDNGHFEVSKGITVKFYNPNGTALDATNTSLRNFMVGAGFPVFSIHQGGSTEAPGGHPAGTDEPISMSELKELPRGSLLHDYTLTHFEIDTTESIDDAMNAGQAKAREALGRPDGPIESVIAIDVLTVKEGPPAKLSEAVKLLPERYKVIHCSFCRVNQEVENFFPTYRPAIKPAEPVVKSEWWDSGCNKIPHTLLEQAKKMHEQGKSYRQIAKQLSVSVGTVSSLLKTHYPGRYFVRARERGENE